MFLEKIVGGGLSVKQGVQIKNENKHTHKQTKTKKLFCGHAVVFRREGRVRETEKKTERDRGKETDRHMRKQTAWLDWPSDTYKLTDTLRD